MGNVAGGDGLKHSNRRSRAGRSCKYVARRNVVCTTATFPRAANGQEPFVSEAKCGLPEHEAVRLGEAEW